jgi:hypothetical protein
VALGLLAFMAVLLKVSANTQDLGLLIKHHSHPTPHPRDL